jgi:hypothetical protein
VVEEVGVELIVKRRARIRTGNIFKTGGDILGDCVVINVCNNVNM